MIWLWGIFVWFLLDPVLGLPMGWEYPALGTLGGLVIMVATIEDQG